MLLRGKKNHAVTSFLTAVKKLTEVFPQLLDKLRRVEQKAPANNISSSIQRIRELIAQTRSVASKVKLGMDAQLLVLIIKRILLGPSFSWAMLEAQTLTLSPPNKWINKVTVEVIKIFTVAICKQLTLPWFSW